MVEIDDAPVRCVTVMQADAPEFWARCENDSTDCLDEPALAKIQEWKEEHPKHTVWIEEGIKPFVCGIHARMWLNIIGGSY